jgi:hypothetical protein
MLEQLGREVISYHARMLQGGNAEQYERRSSSSVSRHSQPATTPRLTITPAPAPHE